MARLIPALILILVEGCSYHNPPGTIAIEPLTESNPTSFIFDSSVDQVHAALIEKWRDLLPGGIVHTKENPVWDEVGVVLNEAGNQNDGYIYDGIAGIALESKVYFLPNNKPCLYGADFHIHLTRVDSAKTKVEIFTHKPWVDVGERERRVFPFYSHRQGIFVKVKPTTIEEYTILLNLGSFLGANHMPALKVPNEVSSAQQFHYEDKDIVDFTKDRKVSDWSSTMSK